MMVWRNIGMMYNHLYIAQKNKIPQKYRERGHYSWIMNNYIQLFEFCKQQNYKKVLDFGCGVGMAQTVYEKGGYDKNFELRLADFVEDWNGEKEMFDTLRNGLGIDYYNFTDIRKKRVYFC